MKDWEELINENRDAGEEAREKFFAFLLRKTLTRKQAEEYLLRNKLPHTLVDEAEDMGLIDDLAYSRLFADGHLSWGNSKISYELSMRGVSRQDINNALDDAEDELDRARKLALEWRKSGLEERKIFARLMSRGFSKSSANEAMEE